MNPTTLALLQLILQSLAPVLPGAAQNQFKGQSQAFQRQLSTSDMVNDPKRFMAQLSNMLGVTGGSAGPNSGGPKGAGTTFAGMLKTLIDKMTPQLSQGLTDNIWQQEQPKLAASGLSQAPGIANEEMATALAPFQQKEQEMGIGAAENAMQTAVQTQQSNLGYPFKLGEGLAGQFPQFATF